MRKLKALLIALSLILAILLINVPDINYGQGPEYAYEDETSQE